MLQIVLAVFMMTVLGFVGLVLGFLATQIDKRRKKKCIVTDDEFLHNLALEYSKEFRVPYMDAVDTLKGCVRTQENHAS